MHHLRDASLTRLPEFSAESAPGLDPHFAIRRLVPSDEPAMAKLLLRLDLQARLDRFGHDMGDAALAIYARESLETSPAVFGALIDGGLSGIAEITRLADADAAVLAFAVDGERRRQGIGCRLLLAALAWTAQQGMTSVQLHCARTNWAVRQIAQKANARVNLTAGRFFAEFDARNGAHR